MCGIIGYVGNKNAMPILVNSLKKLDYRGYDSAGISTLEDELYTFKDEGEIRVLEKSIPDMPGTLGIGHTRWATHGGVCKENAHPQLSGSGKIAVVHNGIIANFGTLRENLKEDGYTFKSETDTEVVAHLVEKYYKGDLEEATRRALKDIEGSYALAVMCKDEKNRIVAARKGSPLILGIGENENFATSDISAIIEHTNKVFFLDDGEIASITNDGMCITDLDGVTIEKEVSIIDWTYKDVEKAGYAHYMLKEIHEQPRVVHQAVLGRISEVDASVKFEELDGFKPFFSSLEEISIVACGTSYYAGMYGKYVIESMAETQVKVELATEYSQYIPIIFNNIEKKLMIAITQSGETADTLVAIKRAKNVGTKILVISNSPGSTASRLADWTILCKSGPEIGVAATKTFTSQLTVLYLIALYLGQLKKTIGAHHASELIKKLKSIPQAIQNVLDQSDEIKRCASGIKGISSMFFIGRKNNYPIALEGALKLKEISYIHAEGFSAGELKHGPFALLTEKTPVVALCNRCNSYEKMLSSIVEIKARNAPVIAVADADDNEIKKYVDKVLKVPPASVDLSPMLNTIVCQLFAYHVADYNGCPIDKPRNLAKSVTVE